MPDSLGVVYRLFLEESSCHALGDLHEGLIVQGRQSLHRRSRSIAARTGGDRVGCVEDYQGRMGSRTPEMGIHPAPVAVAARTRLPHPGNLCETKDSVGLRWKHRRPAKLRIQQPARRKSCVSNNLRLETKSRLTGE